MRAYVLLAPVLFSLTISGSVRGQEGNAPASGFAREAPGASLKQNAERGWFFYERQIKPALSPLPKSAPAAPEPKEERCRHKETWSADCGFVDPGKDFDFQSKQRDALLQAMSMSRNDPKAVENFQFYMKWLLERSLGVANLWYYNMVQNPELDATVKAPISTFGLRLMTEVRDSNDASILSALKEEGAFLVYFSRTDCAFCRSIGPILEELARSTRLDIWNTSLDNRCMGGFESRCRRGAQAVAVAQALQVTIVPTLFLYVPGSDPAADSWIRISTGVTDASTMRGRVVSFFSAYRNALLKGVANAEPGRVPVDFSETAPTGTAVGVSGAQRLPTEAEIKALFAR